MAFCPQCGNNVIGGAKFCTNCGCTVSAAQANYSAPPNQPQAEGKNMASKGLNFSILSLVGAIFAYAPGLSIIAVPAFFLGIAGIVLGIIGFIKAKKAGQPAHMAIVVLVLSALSILICIATDHK
jgi:hypothetical protein